MANAVAVADARKALLDSYDAIRYPSGRPLWHVPYSIDAPQSCYLFVIECCWTYNEADGPIDLIPDNEYVKRICYEWWECRRTGRTLIIEKSRRLVVSWILRGLELWALGVKRGKHVIVGLTYGKAAEHVWRIWHLWEQLCTHLRWHDADSAEHRGGNPDGQRLDEVMLPNGSLISKINQEGDSFQGSGYSGVTHEEFSLFLHPAVMYSQSRLVTQGVAGSVGGFVVLVTNSAFNVEWQERKEVVGGVKDQYGKMPYIKAREVLGLDECGKTCLVMPGLSICDTRGGARYLALHYSADPLKTQPWVTVESKDYGKREWDNQMELVEEVFSGEPVLKDYSPSRHCPKSVQDEGIPIFRQSAYFGGWDVDLRPSFILIQVTPLFQIQAILEVVSEGGESMESFCPRIQLAIQKRLPGNWDQIMHGADPTCVNRTAADANSVQKVARSHGFKLHPQSNVWGVRLADVTWALVDEIDERTPRFVIDPVHCPVLLRGFKGAYKYRESTGDEIGPGRVVNKPLKDGYAGPQDALQYALRLARRFCTGKLVLGLGQR